MVAKVTKGQALRKAKRNVGAFDTAFERTLVSGQTAAQRDELASELRALSDKLKDNRTTVLSLLAGVGEGTADGRELVAAKETIDVRLAKHEAFAEAFAARAKSVGQTLDPEEQSIVDTIAFLLTAGSRLRQQIISAEAALERALSSVSNATTVADQQRRMATFDALLLKNEDRQWHIERLELVERKFTAEQLSVEQVLGVKDAVDSFVKYNESTGYKADRSIYAPLGLGDDPPKAAAARAPPAVAYIHDDDDDDDSAGEDGVGASDHFELHDLVPPPSNVGALEDDGWEVAVKKKARAQREREINAPPPVPVYEDEMPEEERPANHRTVPCREWLRTGACSYGGMCTFLHAHVSQKEVKPEDDPRSNPFYRTRPCQRFQAGRCPDGDDCRYRHDGPEQSIAPPLRPPSDEQYVSSQKTAEREQATPLDSASAKVKIIRKDKYKTALCDKFDSPAGCPYRNTCQYAHGPGELVVHSPKVAKAAPAPAPPVFDMRQEDFPEFAHALDRLVAASSGLEESVAQSTTSASAPSLPVASQMPLPAQSVVAQRPVAPKTASPPPPLSAKTAVSAPAPAPPSAAQSAQPVAPLIVEASSLQIALAAAAIGERSRPQQQQQQMTEPPRMAAPVPAPAAVPTPAPAPAPTPAPAPARQPSRPTVSQTASSASVRSSRASDSTSNPSRSSSTTTSQPAARAPRLVGLLPLGPAACLNHMILGTCLNGAACLSRHVVNADDGAAGLLPLLGPGACLNHFLAGSCANAERCLARHTLSEDDYAAQSSKVNATDPTPPPVAVYRQHPSAGGQAVHPQPLASWSASQQAPSSHAGSLSTGAVAHEARLVAQPAQTHPTHTYPVAAAAPQPMSDYPDHLSRAVADLVVSDDEEEPFAVTDEEDSDRGGW